MGGRVNIHFYHHHYIQYAKLYTRHKIESTVASGTSIVLDRYYFSGIVYTLAKRNPSVTFSWARAPDVGLPAPDVCFFLDISAEDAAKRGGGYGEEKYETRERQKAVREEFYRLCEYEGDKNILKVDAGKSMEEVEATLLATVKEKLQDASNHPLGKMLAGPSS
jgi:dTMP kinase